MNALPSESGRGRAAVWLIGLLLLLGGAAAAWFVHARGAERAAKTKAAKAPHAVPVAAVPARKGDMPLTLTGIGTVIPLETVVVRTRVDGQLMKVAFTEGDVVREGALLAEIDPRPYEVQRAQAEGQRERDRADLENAKIDLARYKDAREAVTDQQISTQEAKVRQIEAAIKVDEAQVAAANLELTYCRITAPTSGRIGLRRVDPGNIVHAGDVDGLAVITGIAPISIVFTLPQDDVAPVLRRSDLGKGLAVEAYDRDQRTRIAAGSLLTIDNQVDLATGTVRLKAVFANDDRALFPNEFVNARLVIDTRKDAVIVPWAAVQRSPRTSFVYVVVGARGEETVEMRPVELGPAGAEEVSIASGLAPGEPVVTEGVDRLRPGARVTTAVEGGRDATGAGGASTGPAP